MTTPEKPKVVEPTSWILEQMNRKISQWTMVTAAAENCEIWSDVEKNLDFITNEANNLTAAKLIDWDGILSPYTQTNRSRAIVLDLGCGMGWLSAMLSKYPAVEIVYCLDSDMHMLAHKVPIMFELMKGDFTKAHLVNGLFDPILLEDNSVDLIVASSSFHHSENIFGLFRECRRVLRQDGVLVVLGENPLGKVRFIMTYVRKSLRMLFKIVTGRVEENFQKLSHVGILYDPVLGDWDYLRTAWDAAARMAGFSFIEIDTGLPPYKHKSSNHTIRHLLCRAVETPRKSSLR